MAQIPSETIAQAHTVVHGLWHSSSFFLFGLQPGSDRATEDLLASPESLGPLIAELSGDGLLSQAARHAALELWVPRTETVASRSDFSLISVAGLSFGPTETIDFLVALSDDTQVTCGDSLHYWKKLAAFAGSLIQRQQFLPDLRQETEACWTAHWRLCVRDPRELAWLEQMVRALPPVCRSAKSANNGRGSDPAQIVDNFLRVTTDALIRRSLSSDEFFNDIPQRAKEDGRLELRWLAGLVTSDAVVNGEADELDSIAAGLRDWSQALDDPEGENAPHLCITLQEPAADGAPQAVDSAQAAEGKVQHGWGLTITLHEGEDGAPLDIDALWADDQAEPTLLGRRMSSRREQLTTLVKRGARIFPELRRAMDGATPGYVALSAAEAHGFIRESAGLLRSSGFHVELPEWAQQLRRWVGLQLSVSPRSEGAPARAGVDVALGSIGLRTMLDFNWRVAVGNEELDLQEFEKLVAQQQPLVRFRDGWLDLDQKAAAQALKFMRDATQGPMTLLQALRMTSGAEEIDSGLPIVGMTASGWVDQFLRNSPELKLDRLEQPPEFAGDLRPYQLRGLEWLAFLDRVGLGACLADDMGLGKTIQLIALMLYERQGGATVGPTLLFAPMSVVGNWEREIQRFGKRLKTLVHHGPFRLTGDAFVEAAMKHDVVITTYGLASREQKDFSRVGWHRIAMDEAQKIKNPAAHQTVALRALQAPHKVALTGTPVENHLSELWSIMDALNPGLLGSAASFRARFAVPIEKSGDKDRATQLRRLIHPFVLRRLKSDPTVLADLPEKMEMRVYCNLTSEQAATYEKTVNTLLSEVDASTGIRRRGLILATLTKLKQICNHPVHFSGVPGPLDGRSGKCERLIEMLEEVLEEGDAALVFTQYRKMGDLLLQLITQRLNAEVPFLHGGTPAKKRNMLVDHFQDQNSNARIFLLSLRAGGFGLNLTRANHVFHFDRWWNPAVEEQATDRAHRIGQTRRVQVHKFVCVGTVEERIDKLLTEKSALADKIIGSGDDWLTGLSTVELREYLTLGADAVSEE